QDHVEYSNETCDILEHHNSNQISSVKPVITTATTTSYYHPFLKLIFQPLQRLQLLSSQLRPSFVLGSILVYGLNQGFTGSFAKVVGDYYYKDVQRVQPSAIQLYGGLFAIPWVLKPIWGLMTDVFPVKGYRRRPYFVLAGLVGAFSAAIMALGGRLALVAALICSMGISAAAASRT
ncbi:Folate-biopterin transporter, partial [Parasponia andersonii]